ncbi:hypothetical protein YB2330_002730 [Saitoella coloradoensis]
MTSIIKPAPSHTLPKCCTIPPLTSTYEPKGSMVKIADLDCYSAGPVDSETVIVAIYDIFGILPNTQQGCDVLAETLKCRVVMPDWFKGNAVQMPITDMDAVYKFVYANLYPAHEAAFKALIEQLKADGAKKLGAYGFCWGSKILLQADAFFGGIALVHPSLLEDSDADNVKCPVALLASKEETIEKCAGFWEKLEKKEFAEKNMYKRYDDVAHGFAAARSDWSEGKVEGERARDVYQTMSEWFKAVL